MKTLPRNWRSLGDVYCNDAFAVAHRAHASVVAITEFAPICVAGFLMKNELLYFHRAMEDPARPMVAIIGGAKISSKISAIENLMDTVDKLILGGAMANTFLKAIYYDIGAKSLIEEELVEKARSIMRKARRRGVKFYIPVDCVVADRLDKKAETKITTVQEVPDDWLIGDIGPATSYLYAEALSDAKTIIWNGPMGAFEIDAFSRGTFQMVQTVANTYSLTIVGGGDTDVAVHRAGESSRFSYISTGGGAFLKLMEGAELPGILALEEHARKHSKRVGAVMSKAARRPIIAGNWKMHKTQNETRSFIKDLAAKLPKRLKADVVVAPPFTALAAAVSAAAKTPVTVAAQNMHQEEKGAFTGEISASMLKALKVPQVIIGHSERRQYFKETNKTVGLKVKAALAAGLDPIICVGETLKQREAKETFKVLGAQVKAALAGVTAEETGRIVMAYEPVWAIGTGRTATPEIAQEAHAFIRKELAKCFDKALANSIRILYGGSVKPDNASELMAQPDVDGALVGGASLKVEDFIGIIKF